MTAHICDRELLGRLLLRLEADVHRAGWNAPPHLRVLYEARVEATAQLYRQIMPSDTLVGPPTRQGPYAARVMLRPQFFLSAFAEQGVQPWEALRSFVLALAAPQPTAAKPRQMLDYLRRPGVIGFAWSAEAWSTPPEADEATTRKMLRGELPIIGTPGAREERLVNAITRDGRLALVRRVRGGKPALDLAADDVRGDWSTSLRILVDAVNGTAPPADEFAVRYPSLGTMYSSPGTP